MDGSRIGKGKVEDSQRPKKGKPTHIFLYSVLSFAGLVYVNMYYQSDVVLVHSFLSNFSLLRKKQEPA